MSIFSRIIPYIVLGVMLVILAAGFVLLSYLLIFGALVGFVLFVLAWARDKFLVTKSLSTVKRQPRIFEHDDNHHS